MILWVVSVTLGVAIYTVHLYPPLKEQFINYLPKTEAAVGDMGIRTIATFLLFVPLLALLARLRSRKKREPMVYHTAEGPVVIESATLSRFVKSVIKAYDEVNLATVRTAEDNRKINIIARVYLNDTRPVAAVVAEIQLAVRRRVQEAFGLDLLRDIRIEVARLAANRRRLRKLLGLGDSSSPREEPGKSNSDIPREIPPAEYQAVETNDESR